MDLKSLIFSKIFNMNKRKLGITLITLCVAILILFPFIDTNFFYPSRIKNRIEILDKITKLDMNVINQDQYLIQEYNNIVKEINESDSNYINKILKRSKKNHTIEKFISGGVLWWFLGFMVLFFYNILNKDKNVRGKNWGTRIAGFVVCLIFGGLTGLICSIIPTIINVWVNYIVIPILVLILMFLLLYKTTSNN